MDLGSKRFFFLTTSFHKSMFHCLLLSYYPFTLSSIPLNFPFIDLSLSVCLYFPPPTDSLIFYAMETQMINQDLLSS